MVKVRREIGFIFQGHNLFESLMALENVSLALEIETRDAAERRRTARDVLERLGLAERLDHKPQALSGGQRQRVAVALALAHRPRLVLADEPTAALDGESGREIVTLLRELARERGVAVLLVTHDGRILDVADRIVNMVDGAIVSDVAVRATIDNCQFLVKCPLFTTHTASALAEFAQSMVLEHFAKGAVVIRQGVPGDRFYVIWSGTAEVIVARAAGEVVRTVLGVGGLLRRGRFADRPAAQRHRRGTRAARALSQSGRLPGRALAIQGPRGAAARGALHARVIIDPKSSRHRNMSSWREDVDCRSGRASSRRTCCGAEGHLMKELVIPIRDRSVTASHHGEAATAVVLGHGAGGTRLTPLGPAVSRRPRILDCPAGWIPWRRSGPPTSSRRRLGISGEIASWTG